MRVLIVDDEAAARRRLALMLQELDVEVVGEAENGVVALDEVRRLRPDLLLLDIQMPEVDGFDVARHLPEPRPLLVFQTAYDEHALRAFDHAAVDYLVKPVSMAHLQRALARAGERLSSRAPRPLGEEVIRTLRDAVGAAGARRARLLVRQGAGHRLVPYEEVLSFAVEDSLVYARTASARYLTDYTLSELEQRAGEGFLRTSRGELVNLDAVVRILPAGDGSSALELSDGSQVRVSRRRAAAVRESLGG